MSLGTTIRRFVSSFVALLLVVGTVPAAPVSASDGQRSVRRAVDAVSTAPALPVSASRGGASHAEGRLLVRYGGIAAASESNKAAIRAKHGARHVRSLDIVPGLELVSLPRGLSVAEGVRRFSAESGVIYAEPDYVVSSTGVPNDPRFGMLWGLHNTGQTGGTPGADISALDAWEITTGSSDVIVAVVDSGVDYLHPELAGNMWVNPGEVAGNGLDDDGNGRIDDVHGYNFVANSGNPMDDHGHGTHVAGTIGAVSDNGVGVTGVAWNVRIMALKTLDASGNGYSSYAIDAINYATQMGADIINNSWGGGGYSQSLKDAIDATDALVVCAAGNDNKDNDSSPFYPASFPSPNIISVAATTASDEKASFSNYGVASVDLAAPGAEIWSTAPASPTPRVIAQDDCSSLAWWDSSVYHVQPWTLRTDAYVSPPSSIGQGPFEIANWNPPENPEIKYDSWLDLNDYEPMDLTEYDRVFVEYHVRHDLRQYEDFMLLRGALNGLDYTMFDGVTGSSGAGFAERRGEITSLSSQGPVYLAFHLRIEPVAQWNGSVYVDDVVIYGEKNTDPRNHENAYQSMSGTSMASPHVAGVAALVYSRIPTITATEARAIILDSVDPVVALSGKVATGGRLNAAAAVEFAEPDVTPPVVSSDALLSYVGTATITITAEDEQGGSGVESVSYRVNDEATQTVTGDTAVATIDEPGFYELYFWAEDVVGNISAESMAEFVVTPSDPLVGTMTLAGGSAYSTTSTVPVDSSVGAATEMRLRSRAEGAPWSAWSPWGEYVSSTTISAPADGLLRLQVEYRDEYGRLLHAEGGIIVDTQPPVTTDDAELAYVGEAIIAVSAADFVSGVTEIVWMLDDAPPVVESGDTASILVSAIGDHTLAYWARDAAGNVSTPVQRQFTVLPYPLDVRPLEGSNRFDTAVAISQAAFPDSKGVDTVVIATGHNWPDALGGSALAGVLGGPVLLVNQGSIPASVEKEIARLGAHNAVVLGGSAVVGTAVEQCLKAILPGNVTRIAGSDRYQTAERIAARVISQQGASFSGSAFVATGGNFPDALAAAPISAAEGWPVYLAKPGAPAPVLPPSVDHVVILGGEGAVSSAVQSSLAGREVERLEGPDRYDTALRVAEYAIDEVGFGVDGLAVATGASFPDALAGGVLQGASRSVLLLSGATFKEPGPAHPVTVRRTEVVNVRFLGGEKAVPAQVRNAVCTMLRSGY